MGIEHKVIKNKKVDKEKQLTLKVSEDGRGERLYVEFSAEYIINGQPDRTIKLKLQKNFPNTLAGKIEAEYFISKFKSVAELKAHLGIN